MFITGVTLTNKTLPRLLQLSRNSHVVLVGPSTPLSEVMLSAGVNALCGFVAGSEEAVRARRAAGGGPTSSTPGHHGAHPQNPDSPRRKPL